MRTTSSVDVRLEVVDRVEQALHVGALVLAASARRAPRSASAPPGAGSRGARRRRAPPSGRVCSGGTSTTRSSRAGARQARRQPSRSSSGAERARVERADRHVAAERPAPCTSCTCRGRRRSSRSRCRSSSRRRRRRAARHAHLGAVGQEAQPDALGAVDRGRVVHRLASARAAAAPRRHDGRRRLRRLRARGARRSSARPTRRGRAAGRPRARRSTTPRRVLMIALVSPAADAIARKAALSAWRSGRPKDTFEAPRHMFTPSSSRISADRLERDRHGLGSAPTVIASGSMTTSSGGMP